jgi:FkbM family methyltransferase
VRRAGAVSDVRIDAETGDEGRLAVPVGGVSYGLGVQFHPKPPWWLPCHYASAGNAASAKSAPEQYVQSTSVLHDWLVTPISDSLLLLQSKIGICKMKSMLKMGFNQLLLAMPERLAFRTLLTLCERYHLQSVVADIRSDLIEGSLYDQGMFSLLIRRGSYADHAPYGAIEQVLADSPTGTYLDIGANIGTTTIPVAGKYGWDFHVFEPDPVNFRRLQSNLVRNGVAAKVHANNLAVSDRTGTVELRQSPYNLGDHRIVASKVGRDTVGWRSVTVRTDSLDHLFADTNLKRPLVA